VHWHMDLIKIPYSSLCGQLVGNIAPHAAGDYTNVSCNSLACKDLTQAGLSSLPPTAEEDLAGGIQAAAESQHLHRQALRR
jgi:hypothetical protein